jgi:hypothetical protein
MAIDLEAILRGYGAGLCHDQRFVKLLSYLEAQSLDGTEVNGIVRKELSRFGFGAAANNIIRAIEQEYGGTVRIHVVVELFAALLEKEELA